MNWFKYVVLSHGNFALLRYWCAHLLLTCRFFSYSLEGRIIPRHKVMVENRVNFKLRYMLAPTDEEFDQKVRAAVERRQRFESGFLLDGLKTPQTTDGCSLGTEVGARLSSDDVGCSSEEFPQSGTARDSY